MWRQEKGITVRGENIPNPVLTFAETNFPKYMLDAFRRHNWTTPTDIQAQSWSVAMQGRDLVGIAKTGSGKTLSFGIPGLLHIAAQPPLQRGDGPIMLTLAPTRELAIQIEQEIRKVCPRNVSSVSSARTWLFMHLWPAAIWNCAGVGNAHRCDQCT